jgi:hypothetical protein
MTTAVAQMGATEARALTDQIKVAVEATWELVKRLLSLDDIVVVVPNHAAQSEQVPA